MDYQGVVLTGTSGAGKTSVAWKLCEISKAFTLVPAVTTRKQRDDDRPGEYSYISEDDFIDLRQKGELLIESKYRGDYYGITIMAFQKVVTDNKVPLLVITADFGEIGHLSRCKVATCTEQNGRVVGVKRRRA